MGIFATIMLVLSFLVIVASLVGIALSIKYKKNDPLFGSLIAGGVALVVFIVFFCPAVITIVPTKNRGVVTTFGHVDYEMDNGFHLTYPWQNVTNMDGTVQLEQFEGATDDSHTGNAVLVTLGNNTKAHANASIMYHLDPGSLGGLYQNFRDNETIKKSLVNTNFDQALNQEMGKFNKLLEEKAKTRVSEQAELTAAAQAAANNTLRDSLKDDPNVLVSKCLDLIRDGKLNSAVGCSPGSVGPGVPIIQVPGH